MKEQKNKTLLFIGALVVAVVLIVCVVLVVVLVNRDNDGTTPPTNVGDTPLTGVEIVQRNLRDTKRREVLREISLFLTDYYVQYYAWPDVEFRKNEIRVGDHAIDVDEYLQTAEDCTSTTETAYFYERTTDGYRLCAVLETGEVFNMSIDGAECELAEICTAN